MFLSIQSKFKLKSQIVTVLLFLGPIIYGLVAGFYLIPSGYLKNSIAQYVIAGVVAVLNPLMVYFAMRKRLFKLELSDYGIKGRAFLGYGKEKEWSYPELDGFAVKVSEAKDGKLTETIKFLKSGNVELEISDDFYANYEEIKQVVASKMKEIND